MVLQILIVTLFISFHPLFGHAAHNLAVRVILHCATNFTRDCTLIKLISGGEMNKNSLQNAEEN